MYRKFGILHFLILILSLIVIQQDCLGQNSNTQYAHLSVGSIGTISQLSLGYEHIFVTYKKFRFGGKLKVGKLFEQRTDYAEYQFDFYSSLSSVLILSFIELNVGIAYMTYNYSSAVYNPGNGPTSRSNSEPAILPDVELGFRFETKSLVFRAGLGFPELAYIGFGYGF